MYPLHTDTGVIRKSRTKHPAKGMTGSVGPSNSCQSLLHQKIDRIMPQGVIGGKNCIGVSNPIIVQFLGHSRGATIDTMLDGANHFKKILNYLPGFVIHGDLLTFVSFHPGVRPMTRDTINTGLNVAGQSKNGLRSLVNQNTPNKLLPLTCLYVLSRSDIS